MKASKFAAITVTLLTLGYAADVVAPAASAEPVAPSAANRPAVVAAKKGTSGAPSIPGAAPALGVRMEIAAFLERQQRFRKYDDDGAPKLTKATIAGPIQVTLLADKPPITGYCVEVDLIMTNHLLWATHDPMKAVVTFMPTDDGKTRIGGTVKSENFVGSKKCHDAPFTPFPELEQLRDKRRHELGKADK